MKSQRSVKPVVHIGPPKTATTSLQDGVIPRLGRPYQIKPDWARALARHQTFHPPKIAGDVIVSDEILGDFATFVPQVIAERLATVFDDAVIVLVRRDPVDLFYSLYRQKLINAISLSASLIANENQVYVPLSTDAFFDAELAKYRKSKTGFFALIQFEKNKADFATRFDVEVIDFAILRSAPAAFARSFVDLCGGGPQVDLPHENSSGDFTIENALAASPLTRWPKLVHRYRDLYKTSVLGAQREGFIRAWPTNRTIETFVNAFRF